MDLGKAALFDWKVSLWKYHVSPAEGRKAGRQQMLLNTSGISFPSGHKTCLFTRDSWEQRSVSQVSLSPEGVTDSVSLYSPRATKQNRIHRVSPAHQRSSQYHILITFFTEGFIYWTVYLGDCTLFQSPFLLRLCVLRNAVESLYRHEKRTVRLV